MQRRKNNLFFEKFKSLNSQEHSEEIIIQTSSDSSDYENVQYPSINTSAKKVLKRKRKCNQKVPKNLSNLDITICNAGTDVKGFFIKEKSPILLTQKTAQQQKYSPILKPLQISDTCSKIIKLEPVSPILKSNMKTSVTDAAMELKSPILTLKYSSPKSSKKVKKQLFTNNEYSQTKSPTVFTNNHLKLIENHEENNVKDYLRKSETIDQFDNTIKEEKHSNNSDFYLQSENIEEKVIKKETLNEEDTTHSLHRTLAKKIQSFFDNNFGSDSASQHSISDIVTQNSTSKTSDSNDILTLLSQNLTNRQSNDSFKEIKHEVITGTTSYESLDYDEKPRKIKYKKDGLAYRLNILLRKHNSIISLWQHERFLAENSNFLIPKSECVLFRVQKVNFKYGCFVIEAMNVDSEQFIIVINSSIVVNENISPEVVLKIYVPYKVVEHLDFKIVLNVCKFECVTIKK